MWTSNFYIHVSFVLKISMFSCTDLYTVLYTFMFCYNSYIIFLCNQPRRRRQGTSVCPCSLGFHGNSWPPPRSTSRSPSDVITVQRSQRINLRDPITGSIHVRYQLILFIYFFFFYMGPFILLLILCNWCLCSDCIIITKIVISICWIRPSVIIHGFDLLHVVSFVGRGFFPACFHLISLFWF